MWLEDMLVIDAVTLYPRYTRGGDLYAVDVIDGSTITPLVADDGRTPEPPDPAYQQVLHGVPAADFSGRRTALSAAQSAPAKALWHEPGRAGRADRQHRAPARHGDARLLPARLDARRLRDAAERLDARSDQAVPGLFRRADERQFGAPPHGQIHAERFRADARRASRRSRTNTTNGSPESSATPSRSRPRRSSPRSTARPRRRCACRRRRKGSCR